MSKVIAIVNSETPGQYQYRINTICENEFIDDLNSQLFPMITSNDMNSLFRVNIEGLSTTNSYSFVHHAVRGFLRNDLYHSVTELLSRAKVCYLDFSNSI